MCSLSCARADLQCQTLPGPQTGISCPEWHRAMEYLGQERPRGSPRPPCQPDCAMSSPFLSTVPGLLFVCFVLSLIPEFPATWKGSDRLSRNRRVLLQFLFYLCNCTQVLKAETAAILIQHSLSIPEVTKQVQDVLMKLILLLFLKHTIFWFPHS